MILIYHLLGIFVGGGGGLAWVEEDVLSRHVVLKKTDLDKTDLQKGYRTFIFINVTVT